METKPIFTIFAELIERKIVTPDGVLRASEAKLRAALAAVAECRELLNAPEFDDPVALGGVDGPAYAEGLREQLSGKRFPELQGVLLEFADGLRKQGPLLRSSGSPQLFEEAVAMDQALARVVAAAHRLCLGSLDISTICFPTGIALCQRVLSAVRARLEERPAPGGEPDPAAPTSADLRDVFAGLLETEIATTDAEGRTQTALRQLARSYFRVRDGEPDAGKGR